MQEPLPKDSKPPQTEPVLRVGVVLEEDACSSINIHVTERAVLKSDSSATISLEPKQKYLVSISGRSLVCHSENATALLSGTRFFLSPVSSQALTPNHGISLDPITVGRHFHWRKQVKLTFPGAIEFHQSNKNLVVVNEVRFEDYIACVVSSEMGIRCPEAFTKAQAVAARSWALCFLGHKHTGTPYTICNDDDCQRYQGSTFINQATLQAALACRGEFLIRSDGFVCPAYYSKSCGGHTETSDYALGLKAFGTSSVYDGPHKNSDTRLDLQKEEDLKKWIKNPELLTHLYCAPTAVNEKDLPDYLGAVDTMASYFRWIYEADEAELRTRLADRLSIKNLKHIDDIKVLNRGNSGRAISLQIQYTNNEGATLSHTISSQYEIRRALHPSFLLSSAFLIERLTHSDGKCRGFRLEGAGWGHGVGLCQIGGVGMALQGAGYKEILKHYFPLTTLVKAY